MSRPALALVDDNAPQRMILSRLLENDYVVSAFESGEALLAGPLDYDAILLDIELPGLNGYEVCRRLRSGPGQAIPVIFVSAHDTAPERVAAYEAGGDDFVTKPIAADELRHKLTAMLETRQQLHTLAEQSSAAQQVAFTAMSSMGDLGVVIEFLRRANACRTYPAVAEQLLDAMAVWGLRGAAQVRGRHGTLNAGTGGRLTSMQTTVLETMRDIGRLFEMGSRAIVNYEHVSLLVENMPTNDPDKTGRLRDHLAVLVESADMRIAGLDAMQERDLQKVGIHGALAELKGVLGRINERARSNRNIGQVHMLEALEHLSHTLGTLGLSDTQREYVDDLVKCTLDDTRHYFDEAAGLEGEFGDVLARLERLAASDYRV